MRVLVTGGCGFIGSAVVRHLIAHTEAQVLNLDKLTYAATPEAIGAAATDARYRFVQADVSDAVRLNELFDEFRPTHVMHLAAESHVDRSIDGPAAFIQTNVTGTYTMLEAARRYFETLTEQERKGFLFHHISTDEVFGSLGPDGAFSETSPYDPRSPYSASKASSDHLVRAWHHTYGLPTLVTNCSNNYGPYQFPEKLIPLATLKAIAGERIPVYGKGDNVRDWLYVDDHACALVTIVARGKAGDTFNVGGKSERKNLAVIETLCRILDEELPNSPHRPHYDLVTFVSDRPGHDQRYAIDPGKLERELGFSPSVSFEEGLRHTVKWYLENEAWWRPLLTQRYQGQRLGTAKEAASNRT